MFGVSIFELLFIFAIVLVVFGPDKLPEIASSLGKLSASLRKNVDLLRREFYNSVYKPAEDFRNQIDSASRNLASSLPDELESKLLKPDPNCPDYKEEEEQEKDKDEDEA